MQDYIVIRCAMNVFLHIIMIECRQHYIYPRYLTNVMVSRIYLTLAKVKIEQELSHLHVDTTCMWIPPRLLSLTRLLDTYMASSRWVFGLPNVPHVSPQANVAARRCLGDRLISMLPWMLTYPTPPVLDMASGCLSPFHFQYI